MTTATTAPPLEVLEIGDEIRTGYCAYLFARWGASVTRFGGAQRDDATATYLDRGKNLVSDLNSFDDLVARADVIITPSSAQLAALAGIGLDALSDQHPALVIGVASAFGEHGSYAAMRGGEPQELALGGLMSMIGERWRQPLRLGGPQAEHAAGMSLFTGIGIALFQRSETGRGAVVGTSAVRSIAYLDWKSQIHYAADGIVLQRGSTAGPLVLRCSDGFVGFYYRDEEWDAVKRLVGDPRLDDERFATQLCRDGNREEFVGILAEYSAGVTRTELYHSAQALKIPAGSVLTLSELHDDPQLVARNSLHTEATGDRTLTYPLAPWTVDGRREASA